MKTGTWIGLLAVLLLLCGGLSAWLLLPNTEASLARITSGGQPVRTVSLNVDQEFQITGPNGTNTVTVRDGKIAVTDADCPDHYCMDRGYLNSGTPIVCLPNSLVIEFVTAQEVDAAVG